jgi:hypothetical protein
MSDEQFRAFVVWLAVATVVTTTAAMVTETAAVTAVSVPVVLLLHLLARNLQQKGGNDD